MCSGESTDGSSMGAIAKVKALGGSAVSSIAEFLTRFIELLSELFRRKWSAEDELKAERKRLENELALALKEGRVTDAGFLRKKLEGLGAIVLICLLLSGCKTVEVVDGPVLGERINVVKPGAAIVVPELKAPASKWYLVDDVGLRAWLGLDVSAAGVADIKEGECRQP